MSVRTLGYPADLKRELPYRLPKHIGEKPWVQVTPRTEDGRKSPVWAADFYEVNAYYTWSSPDLIPPLEDAIRALPGVYRVTRVAGTGRIDDADWPVGSTRRDKDLRTQVIALMRDPDEAAP